MDSTINAKQLRLELPSLVKRVQKGERFTARGTGLSCFFFLGARHLLPQQLPQQVHPGSQLQAQLGQSQQQSSVVMFTSSKEKMRVSNVFQWFQS